MEEFTVCDFCEHLQKCKEKHLVCDITIRRDTIKHYTLGAWCKCPREDDENDRENV